MIVKELKRLLDQAGYPVYLFCTNEIAECILYNFVPLTSDGIKEQGRLEVTIIAFSMEKAQEMLKKVKEVLLTVGDQPKTNTILEIALNGGGCMENIDTATIHLKAFFSVKSRYREDEENGRK